MPKEKPFDFNKFYDLQNQTASYSCHFREGGNHYTNLLATKYSAI
jgi:hypothetical protein